MIKGICVTTNTCWESVPACMSSVASCRRKRLKYVQPAFLVTSVKERCKRMIEQMLDMLTQHSTGRSVDAQEPTVEVQGEHSIGIAIIERAIELLTRDQIGTLQQQIRSRSVASRVSAETIS